MEQGDFIIADKGQPWNASCSQQRGFPNKKFISAISINDTFRLEYWQGGFVKTPNVLVLHSDGQKVVDHSRYLLQ